MHLRGTPLAPTLADLTNLQYEFLVEGLDYAFSTSAERAARDEGRAKDDLVARAREVNAR